MKQTLITLLITFQVLAQSKSKTEILSDENDFRIEQDAFKNKIKNPGFLYVVYENDTALVAKILKRDDFGKLNQKHRLDIIQAIKEISGKSVDESKTIILNFYFKDNLQPNGSCIDYYVSDSAYKRFIKKKKDVAQFFVTEKDYKYEAENTFEDKQDKIKKTLFKYPVRCGNYIIILPNGNYYRKLGEYKQDEIPENLKSLLVNNR